MLCVCGRRILFYLFFIYFVNRECVGYVLGIVISFGVIEVGVMVFGVLLRNIIAYLSWGVWYNDGYLCWLCWVVGVGEV